ncbi:MAG TPA: PucR family transcriptional regulator [Clostridiaceae bacterium]|nr:PucR family transcriptional regulator [Clostridiaceae bacterium]
MSVKLFRELVRQVEYIVNQECGIIDENGIILACSNESNVGKSDRNIQKIADSDEQLIIIDGKGYQKVNINNRYEYIVYLDSDNQESLKYLSLIALNVKNMGVYYDEKFDRSNFIRNIILNNILPGDITLRAKELRVASNAYRVVFLIKTEGIKDAHPYEVILSLFPNRTKDFIVVIDDESSVLVKELKSESDIREIERISKIIIDTLNTELMVRAMVGIGTIVNNIRDIGRSYKEAQTALLVGGIFENEKTIINYNNLGIGRLIYQLPTTLCKLFLNEVFKDNSLDLLDSEIFHTIQKFFENNLNVSETSRQLYVHRNTLVYRLDKIQKLTGLDLRKFDDALIFKFSMMVKKYLDKVDKIL